MFNFRKAFLTVVTMLGIGAVAGAAEKRSDVLRDVVGGSWQHHSANINYFGVTTLFSCRQLEGHVRAILVYFGARKDAKVFAYGCRGADLPSEHAVVEADFFTLTPAADSSGVDSVPAHWATRDIQPDRPHFMDDGDCELIRDMKDTISNNFALRELQYDTDCTLHQLSSNGYHVKSSALVPVPLSTPSEPRRR